MFQKAYLLQHELKILTDWDSQVSSSQQILAFCAIVQVLSLQIVPFSEQSVLLYMQQS
jgi:hypothetical protein